MPLASHITGPFEQRSPVRKRLAVSAVYVAVLAALVAGTTAYASLDKTVHISVDGTIINVNTYAHSVGDVLRRADITVGAHDALAPAASASVHDGSTISIERGLRETIVLRSAPRRRAWRWEDGLWRW